MTSEYLKQQLFLLTYNDTSDAITLRYLVLHLLAKYAETYKKLEGTGLALTILQQFKKLEAAHTSFKDRCRSYTITVQDFNTTKKMALEYAMFMSTDRSLMIAA